MITQTQSLLSRTTFIVLLCVITLLSAGNALAKGLPHPLAATPCVNGMAGSYPCKNVDLMAFMPFSELGGGTAEANDIWGWTDAASGREFAIMGRSNGTVFVEITDPENPVYLGNLPTHTSNSSWRDMKVASNHAYIVSEANNHGMQIFDLTQLLTLTESTTFANTAHFDGFGSAHNVVVNEASDYAYGVGTTTCSGGLHMVDISDPLNPADAGCFSDDGYTHDAQCVMYDGPDTEHVGQEICFNANEDTVTVVDVTIKTAPVQLSRTGYSGRAYTHQGWLTEDMSYLLVNDELDEQNFGHGTNTYIWDVRDLDAPVLISTYTSAVAAIDHNLYTKDNLVYQANYRAGLRILDSSDVANGNLREVGYFDVYPASNAASFNGSWSNYPYFESGIVIVSSIETGLFILKPDFTPSFELSAPANVTVEVCGDGTGAASFTVVNGVFPIDTPVALAVSGLPVGSTAAFSDNNFVPIGTPGNVITVNMSTDTTVASGSYPLMITADSGTVQLSQSAQLDVLAAVSAAPTLIAPANGDNATVTQPVLSWSDIFGASEYTVEIATDTAFTTIVETGTTANTNYTPQNALAATSTYYWRVRVAGQCGGSATSAFTTVAAYCSLPNIAIPDNSIAGVRDTLTINTAAGAIEQLAVSVNLPHTYVGDLSASLVHVNSGITINLWSNVADPASFVTCDGNSLDITLDDNGVSSINDQCDTSVVGTFLPEQSLAAFAGQEITGEWQLSILDTAAEDTGQLVSWCLLPSFEAVHTAAVIGAVTTTDSADRVALLVFVSLLAATVYSRRDTVNRVPTSLDSNQKTEK